MSSAAVPASVLIAYAPSVAFIQAAACVIRNTRFLGHVLAMTTLCLLWHSRVFAGTCVAFSFGQFCGHARSTRLHTHMHNMLLASASRCAEIVFARTYGRKYHVYMCRQQRCSAAAAAATLAQSFSGQGFLQRRRGVAGEWRLAAGLDPPLGVCVLRIYIAMSNWGVGMTRLGAWGDCVRAHSARGGQAGTHGRKGVGTTRRWRNWESG